MENIQKSLARLLEFKTKLKQKLIELGAPILDNTPLMNYIQYVDYQSSTEPPIINQIIPLDIQEKYQIKLSEQILNYNESDSFFINLSEQVTEESDFITVGNIVNVSGNCSGFSFVDYIWHITQTLPENNQEFTLEFVILTGEDVITRQNILGDLSQDDHFSFGLEQGQWALVDKIYGRTCENGTTLKGNIKPNTKYNIKITQDSSSNVSVIYKEENESQYIQGAQTTRHNIPWDYTIGKGYHSDYTAEGFKGSVNLESFTLEKNIEPAPDIEEPEPEPSLPTETSAIDFFNKVEGKLENESNIYSGFSDINYLTTTEKDYLWDGKYLDTGEEYTTNTYELNITTGEDVTTSQAIMGECIYDTSDPNQYHSKGFVIGISQGKWAIYETNSSVTTSGSVSSNTNYTIRIGENKTDARFCIVVNEDSSWRLRAKKSTSRTKFVAPVLGKGSSYDTETWIGFTGKIDLNKSKIIQGENTYDS